MTRYSEKEIKYLITNYGLKSYYELALDLNRTYGSIKRKCFLLNLTANVKQGTSKFSRKHNKDKLNHSCFSNYSFESSYWAGFIAADGCIRKFKNNRAKKLAITLAEKDKDHLEKLKLFSNYNGDLKFKQSKGNPQKEKDKVYNTYNLTLTSNQICEDLERLYNITSRKTLTYNPPLIQNDFIKDCFIMGYIDGDGCISNKNSNLNVLGTYETLFFIRERIDQILNKNFIVKIIKIGNIYSLSYGGRKQVNKIITHFTQYDVPYLKRKWCQNV